MKEHFTKRYMTNIYGVSIVECAKCECNVHEVFHGPKGFIFKCTNCGTAFNIKHAKLEMEVEKND